MNGNWQQLTNLSISELFERSWSSVTCMSSTVNTGSLIPSGNDVGGIPSRNFTSPIRPEDDVKSSQTRP
jgi:hypothetical protein